LPGGVRQTVEEGVDGRAEQTIRGQISLNSLDLFRGLKPPAPSEKQEQKKEFSASSEAPAPSEEQGQRRNAVELRSMPTHAMRPHEWGTRFGGEYSHSCDETA